MTNYEKALQAAVDLVEFLATNPHVVDASEHDRHYPIKNSVYDGWTVVVQDEYTDQRAFHMRLTVDLE